MKESDFKTRMGPIFANIALVDEINRAVPRTQSALLEVMEERAVTISGHTYKLPSPFLVLATLFGIIWYISTPRCTIGSFLLTVRQGYPNRENEREML